MMMKMLRNRKLNEVPKTLNYQKSNNCILIYLNQNHEKRMFELLIKETQVFC
jgi:hypothetical protein